MEKKRELIKQLEGDLVEAKTTKTDVFIACMVYLITYGWIIVDCLRTPFVKQLQTMLAFLEQ